MEEEEVVVVKRKKKVVGERKIFRVRRKKRGRGLK